MVPDSVGAFAALIIQVLNWITARRRAMPWRSSVWRLALRAAVMTLPNVLANCPDRQLR